MTEQEKRNQKLVVCYDPGTSLSKILYRLGEDKVKYLTIEPELLLLPTSSAKGILTASGIGKPQDHAWVRYQKDGSIYVIGRLAKEYRATVSLKRLKYELMVPKILGSLGAIAVIEKLENRFDLDLAVLIPFGEYCNRDDLELSLKSALKNFYFQDKRMQVSLKEYRCYPEGFGNTFYYIKANGTKKFQSQALICLMFGYRNTSMLTFREGTLFRAQSSTTQLGFYDLIDKITAKVSGLTREEVQAAIKSSEEGYHNITRAKREFKQVTKIEIADLIKSIQQDKSVKEKAELELAIKTASEEYWQLLSDWLHEVLPPLRQLDQIIYCGGASAFIEEKIQIYFHQDEGKILSQNLLNEQELLNALKLDEFEQTMFKQQNLALRFTDVWGLFVKFASYETEKQTQVA